MQNRNLILFLSLLLVNTFFLLHAEILSNPYLERRRVTRLRFYLQDIIGGDNRTVWMVAKSNISDVLPSKFGIVAVLDNLITSGPNIESGEIGRMQGVIALADLRVVALSMLLNVVFTSGEYEGSTFSFVGRNPLMDKVREVPIVGGTGAFRMASGYIITNTYFLDPTGIHNIFEYNVETLPNSYLETRRVTRLRFYLQDIIGGDNRTVWVVAKSNISDILSSNFGTVYVLDNLITSGPDIESGEIGRMQGVVALSDFHVTSLSMLLNVVFTRGEYQGSTFSFLGRNPLMDKVREVPIVGGTGAFRMASGYILTRTYSFDEAGIRNVFEYNINIFHMDDGLSLLT